jgi:hypothetical protein
MPTTPPRFVGLGVGILVAITQRVLIRRGTRVADANVPATFNRPLLNHVDTAASGPPPGLDPLKAKLLQLARLLGRQAARDLCAEAAEGFAAAIGLAITTAEEDRPITPIAGASPCRPRDQTYGGPRSRRSCRACSPSPRWRSSSTSQKKPSAD